MKEVYALGKHCSPAIRRQRRTPLILCASPHRLCASLTVQRITPARPVLHSTLADAHIHVSCLLAEFVDLHQPTSLEAYVQVTQSWWRAVDQLVLLPFEAEAIRDLPQYLVECAGVRPAASSNSNNNSGSSNSTSSALNTTCAVGMTAEDEAALLEKWEEWVWTSVPRTVPTAAGANETVGDEDDAHNLRSAHARRDVMSFPELTGLLYSYGRYHRGVHWGAARPENNKNRIRHLMKNDASAAAAYYRRRYLLHPWHGLSCPEGTAQQMPYVHVLRWMLAGKGGDATSPEELWRQHRALESFQVSAPQTTTNTNSPFRALDVCSQSGYVTKLLLRAGADLVVAADADLHALGNTESTYHEHFREDRSGRRGQVLLTRRCDVLPMPEKVVDTISDTALDAQLKCVDESDEKNVGKTSASAAERRRRRAQQEGRGYSGVLADSCHDIDDASSSSSPLRLDGAHGSADGSPFHVVYIHPPAPTTVWPVTVTHSHCSLHSTPWWRSLLRRAAEEGVPPRVILPFVPCTAGPNAARGQWCSPLATMSGLQHAIEALRADVTERMSMSLPEETERKMKPSSGRRSTNNCGSDALLNDEGYVVLVLPRTYDGIDSLLSSQEESEQQQEKRNTPSLADWVVAQLEGYYDLVLRRRCLVHNSSLPGAPLDAFEEALITYPRRLQRLEEEGVDENVESRGLLHQASSPSNSLSGSPWKKQLFRLYQKEWWQDVIVLKKNLTMVRRCMAARDDALPQQLQYRLLQVCKAKTDHEVPWEDSFEYNEYRPRDAASLTSNHWTNLMPTYSYLESEFYDSPSAQRNFLAVGHQPFPFQAKSAGCCAPGSTGDSNGPHMTKDDGVTAASAQAAMNFHTLFAQELRTRRRSKLRKLALSPLERQEWYIDEKLIKSSGARVELMNELAKWDLKDYDT